MNSSEEFEVNWPTNHSRQVDGKHEEKRKQLSDKLQQPPAWQWTCELSKWTPDFQYFSAE